MNSQIGTKEIYDQIVTYPGITIGRLAKMFRVRYSQMYTMICALEGCPEMLISEGLNGDLYPVRSEKANMSARSVWVVHAKQEDFDILLKTKPVYTVHEPQSFDNPIGIMTYPAFILNDERIFPKLSEGVRSEVQRASCSEAAMMLIMELNA